MGLKQILKNVAAIALEALDDLYVPAKYFTTLGENFNSATGENVIQKAAYEIKGAIVNYGIKEIDGDIIEKTDFKFLVPAKVLLIGPKVNDVIKISNIDYVVKHFRKDPADALWIFQMGIGK